MPRRSLLALVALLALVGVAAACGDDDDVATGDEPVPPTADDSIDDSIDDDDGAAGGAAGGTRPASISPREALALDDGMPVVVLGALFADESGWRLCSELAESFPPQCPPDGALTIVNPDDLPPTALEALTEEGGVRWTDQQVEVGGIREGDDGIRVAPEPVDDPDLVGGDAEG